MKYVGTIGDVHHFKIKSQQGFFAGMVGGPTAEQVKTAPEFERTRENMNEFGGCAKAGKPVRTALSALMSKMADSQVTGRLTSVMKKINWKTERRQGGNITLCRSLLVFFGAVGLCVATHLCFPFYSFFFWKMANDFFLFNSKIDFERWQWGKHSTVKNKAYHILKRWKKARV